ncbi:hypothetical protein TRFO_17545 [Tritrichomonas foetus]|uniref:Uncharacterized protein n=1 Tax=Tritrichomonas foetus TaxID=1144522 RepID=A0A1J4KMI2_9EUKA|nr:hypothetical protein TRFO_17545 [Tritrichomonas foetus]|eukprot:OHT12513.1 hypothetical protein TRFO_17545 [Tritrichomonas foetus]
MIKIKAKITTSHNVYKCNCLRVKLSRIDEDKKYLYCSPRFSKIQLLSDYEFEFVLPTYIARGNFFLLFKKIDTFYFLDKKSKQIIIKINALDGYKPGVEKKISPKAIHTSDVDVRLLCEEQSWNLFRPLTKNYTFGYCDIPINIHPLVESGIVILDPSNVEGINSLNEVEIESSESLYDTYNSRIELIKYLTPGNIIIPVFSSKDSKALKFDVHYCIAEGHPWMNTPQFLPENFNPEVQEIGKVTVELPPTSTWVSASAAFVLGRKNSDCKMIEIPSITKPFLVTQEYAHETVKIKEPPYRKIVLNTSLARWAGLKELELKMLQSLDLTVSSDCLRLCELKLHDQDYKWYHKH